MDNLADQLIVPNFSYVNQNQKFFMNPSDKNSENDFIQEQSEKASSQVENISLNFNVNEEEFDKTKPSTSQNSQEDFDNNVSDEVDHNNWFECTGSFASLLDHLTNAKNLLTNIQTDCNIDEYITIIQILDITNTIKEKCELTRVSCESYVSVLEKKRSIYEVDKHVGDNMMILHDPGIRQEIKTDKERDFLIALGPHQPNLRMFPSDGKNRFNSGWYKEYPFLEYSTAKDAAFCFVCFLFPTGVGREKSELAWSKNGVSSWGKMKSSGSKKLGKLQQHFSSVSHKQALRDYGNFTNKANNIDILINKEQRVRKIEEERILCQNTEVVSILFDVAKTLGRQGLAFRGNDENDGNFVQIVQLLSRHNPILGKWLADRKLRPYHVSYMGASSQNEFIEILGKEIQKEVVSEVIKCPFYAVMADHTPDISNKEMLSIVVRSVDENGLPRERLLSVMESKNKTGEATAQDILDTFIKQNIAPANLAFQSYDCAASMSGKFKGAQKKLSELVGHNISYIPCQAHRTNTALEHSCHASFIVAEMFNTLEELYVFFNSSTKRFFAMKEKLAEVENSILIRNLSKTRWTARAETLKAISISYEEILQLLEDISNANDYSIDNKSKSKALGLYKRMLCFDFIVCLMFLKNIFYKMKIITEILEQDDLNIIDAVNMISLTCTSLRNIRNSEEDVNNLIESAIQFAVKLNVDPETDFRKHHRRRLVPKKIDTNRDSSVNIPYKQFYRKEFYLVLDTLIKFLDENLSVVLQNVSPLTNLFSFPLNKKNIILTQIEQAILLFPPSHKIDELALQAELEILFELCSKSEKVVKSMQDVMTIASQNKQIFPIAFKFCRFILTAGYSVATNERKFSLLKFIKNASRSKMNNERLDLIMAMKSERDILDRLNIKNLVAQWAKLKQRRLKVISNL
ncbi:uncharacterized protein LOC126740374 [Anthonomus grandis grandis]|uniref:uncharacterized protein LOC126737276 n=2 Tax=Anthonomus grandis grandis TaxID=2921223 RepID=UPI002165EC29|nr:uncharacterized protein LOC126737276 [Anthonomus grandis grandis]XP_050298072.1 uncharacterized protein LOC126737276 [Anthonomus grandis grandis]XP_050301490.1 uncharacterized protein LOC126739733 [Anthonomus grandis grandis]XP_050301497.1 uncharacterized protein LOC126739733 [Anthonomus grandis grandis]XP_050302309.1 uncharacterized protein LOC126740374 [Anthonomus grandis grandis]XP_050302310.1 uncharacterized protein LOC126740374 [Anthonomus grandis grandis]XP_050302311.1 uncharacterize